MAVAGVPAAQRHALEESVKAQAHHQPDRQPGMLVRVCMAVLDAAREVLEHHLNEKTDQDERPELGPPAIVGEYFRQQVQRGDREQIGAAEGDQQLQLVAIRRLEPQHRECSGQNGK